MAALRLLLAALAVVILAGCTSDADTGGATPTPTATPTVRPHSPGTHTWTFDPGPSVQYDIPEGSKLTVRAGPIPAPSCTEGVCQDASMLWIVDIETRSHICVGRATIWVEGEQPTTLRYGAYVCGGGPSERNSPQLNAIFEQIAESLRLVP